MRFSIKKRIMLAVLGALIMLPVLTSAQTMDEVFKARVLEVLEEKTISDGADGSVVLQKLKLKALEGTWEDQDIIFDGTQYEVVTANQYEVDDKVMVTASEDSDGKTVYYVTNYVRQGALYWLAIIFALIVIAVGRLKGVRALVVLLLTFIIILEFILPQILNGNNPLFISIVGALAILCIAIYLTEGFSRNSSIAIGAISLSLIVTGLLAVLFTHMTRLTGFADDDVFFLKASLGQNINVEGLLLAGIIIGAIGVLDDVVVAQVETVKQLKLANPKLKKLELFSRAMKVGVTHMSAMVNTLFLAYAGASLPLLLLFTVDEPPYLSFGDVLNNELIATEIVRTLTGSIGLILAVPFATFLAANFVRIKPDKKEQKEKLPPKHLHD